MNMAAEDAPHIPAGARLNGIYEVRRLIGRGGMGEVYEGVAVETGIPVAIKMIRPELAADPMISGLFRREATVLHRLRHDSIVGYYVFSVDPQLNATYLAMEFVPGRSLSDVAAERPLDLRSVRILQKRLASGLQAAHELGIIHRDISADNIILPEADPSRAKIIDFGIARDIGETHTILAGQFAGKNNYSSPEQFGLFGGQVTTKSDVYSLGLVLAETMVGHPIDMRGTMAEVIEKREKVPDLSGIDDRMEPLLAWMLQPRPDDRPTMEQVAAWVPEREATGALPTTAPVTVGYAAQPASVTASPSRLPLAAGIGGVAVVALGVVAYLFWPARQAPVVAAVPPVSSPPVVAPPVSSPPAPVATPAQPAPLPQITTPVPIALPPPLPAPTNVAPAPEPEPTKPAVAPEPVATPQPVAPPPAPTPVPPQQIVSAPPPAPTPTPPPTAPDCRSCADMVLIPEGRMAMGSNRDASEKPIHEVTVKPFLIGRFPVTVGDWKACVRANACIYDPKGDDNAPVFNVSFDDVQQYLGWISKITGQSYRLPSEAEWEFAARADTRTTYWWGDQFDPAMAACRKCGPSRTEPQAVGRYPANAYGLYDMLGSVGQWVSDCWHKDYRGAPRDGAAWTAPSCRERVVRGGSWMNEPGELTVSSREFYDSAVRYPSHGFRIARNP